VRVISEIRGRQSIKTPSISSPIIPETRAHAIRKVAKENDPLKNQRADLLYHLPRIAGLRDITKR
jgi:hypothetical protein